MFSIYEGTVIRMEKNTSITEMFIDLDKAAFMSVVLDGGQKVAENIPKFKQTGNGAIVMMPVPLCWEADIWLGGLSQYDAEHKPVNVREYVTVGSIAPGGSHTIQWEDPNDGHRESVNCFAYAMMKIAYLSHLIKDNIPNRDEDRIAKTTGYYCEENGYSQHRGVVCVTIYYCGKALMRVYICFSGATEDEDQQCANQVACNLCSHLKQWDERFIMVMRTVDGTLL